METRTGRQETGWQSPQVSVAHPPLQRKVGESGARAVNRFGSICHDMWGFFVHTFNIRS